MTCDSQHEKAKAIRLIFFLALNWLMCAIGNSQYNMKIIIYKPTQFPSHKVYRTNGGTNSKSND